MRPVVLLTLLSGCVPHLACEDAVGERPVECGDPWVAPENTWEVSPPPEGLVAEGMDVGQVAYDVRGVDQHGDELSLWQFYGDVIVLDVSTMWCVPCQELGIGTEDLWQEFKDEGFVYVTALLQDTETGPVSVEELGQWAQLPSVDEAGAYDVITAPIVSDPQGRSGSARAVLNNQYPAVLILGRDLRVIERVTPASHENVHAAIEAALAR